MGSDRGDCVALECDERPESVKVAVLGAAREVTGAYDLFQPAQCAFQWTRAGLRVGVKSLPATAELSELKLPDSAHRHD